ncbi:geranylgeranyl transferase type-1 subunit beta, partial [Cryomyces antarcticus]
WAGFNGRCNKLADTCYAFWVGASLDVLHKAPIASRPRSRRYLLDRTQHPAGGFAKHPGDPPDIYHSYLGLAALALMREPALKPLDAIMCVSVAARRGAEGLRWRRSIVGEREGAEAEEGAGKGEGDRGGTGEEDRDGTGEEERGTEGNEGTEARGGESRPAAPSSAGTTASASDSFAYMAVSGG